MAVRSVVQRAERCTHGPMIPCVPLWIRPTLCWGRVGLSRYKSSEGGPRGRADLAKDLPLVV